MTPSQSKCLIRVSFHGDEDTCLTLFAELIDNSDPCNLLQIGLTDTWLLVTSVAHSLVFRVKEVPTSGNGPGPVKGTGDFIGPPIPKLGPSPDQVYLLVIRGRNASLTLTIDGGRERVFLGKYARYQDLRDLDGDWTGSWRQP